MLNILKETITNNDKSHFPYETISLEKERLSRRKNDKLFIQNCCEISNPQLEKRRVETGKIPTMDRMLAVFLSG